MTSTKSPCVAVGSDGVYTATLNYDDQDIVNILGEMKSNTVDELEPESERMPVPEPSDDGMPKRETRGILT